MYLVDVVDAELCGIDAWYMCNLPPNCGSSIYQFESDKEILFLRESMKDTGRRIQELEYHYEKLQSNYNSLVPLLGSPHDNMEGPSIFLIGGYRGSTCLSSLDSFCPKTDRVVPLCSMSSARAYAAVAALKDHLYIFGGGDGSSWYHTGKCSNMIKCFI